MHQRPKTVADSITEGLKPFHLLHLSPGEITLHDSSFETELDMLVTAVHLEARLPADWTGHLVSSNFSQ
jgi:hypothetical protein